MNIRRQSGNFQFEEDPFSKNVPGIGKTYHAVLLLMKFLQTAPQVKKMNINYHDLYYTVIKIRDDKKTVDDKMKMMKMIILILMISFLIIILEEEMTIKY